LFHGENDFAKVSKSLARYRSDNNFVKSSKFLSKTLKLTARMSKDLQKNSNNVTISLSVLPKNFDPTKLFSDLYLTKFF